MTTSELRAPVVFDTTVLSNLAVSDDLQLLDAIDERLVTVPTVIDELRAGIDEHDHSYLTPALDALPVVPPESDPDTTLAGLDPGETEALHLAHERDGSLATDDLAARTVANDLDIPVTGSLGVLVRTVHDGTLDRDDADTRLDLWQDAGYHSPVDTIAELLPEEE